MWSHLNIMFTLHVTSVRPSDGWSCPQCKNFICLFLLSCPTNSNHTYVVRWSHWVVTVGLHVTACPNYIPLFQLATWSGSVTEMVKLHVRNNYCILRQRSKRIESKWLTRWTKQGMRCIHAPSAVENNQNVQFYSLFAWPSDVSLNLKTATKSVAFSQTSIWHDVDSSDKVETTNARTGSKMWQ